MKERIPATINLTPRADSFLTKRQEALNKSKATYITDLLIFAERLLKDRSVLPRSRVIIVNEHDEEITEVFTGEI